MPPAQLQWLTLNDFSPGIIDKHLFAAAGGVPAPLGAAQRPDTHRCIALPSGGLGPLPARTRTITSPALDTPTVHGYYAITGMYIFSPVLGGGADLEEVHLTVEYIYNPGTGNQRRVRWLRMTPSNTWGSVVSIDSAQPSPGASYYGAPFEATRVNNVAPHLTPGTPVVYWSWQAVGGGYEKRLSIYPDPSAANSFSVQHLSTTRAGLVGVHQGRCLILEDVAYGHGSASHSISVNEQLSYTTPANSNILGNQQAVYVQEAPFGYGLVASVNAGELFLVKFQGGGVLIQGDLDAPTVIRLPNVMATGNWIQKGTATPIGYVYMSDGNGAWLWRGADSAIKISYQLEDRFYVNAAFLPIINCTAVCEQWGDWVLFSNNWLYDMRSESWWRIEDPSTLLIRWWSRMFDTNAFYGAPDQYPINGAAAAYRWTKTTPSTSYSWRSHPLPISINREVEIREVIVRGIGFGTVDLTFTGINGATTTVSNIPFSGAGRLETVRKNVSIEGTYLDVKIVANGSGGGGAPVIHAVHIGYQERQHLAISST